MTTSASENARAAVDGKFLSVGGDRFLVKGVSLRHLRARRGGTPVPRRRPSSRDDFARMREAGLNTVRTYTTPDPGLLDAAARHGLRVMVGLPWPQHIAFLDDPDLCRRIRGDIIARVRELSGHPAALVFALGNEIPAPVVRWHGQARVERFIRELYHDVKAAAPEALLTYVNYPPTEYLSLPFLDVCAFNVYLHAEADLRRYLARLQHLAGHRPLLLAEAGADSQPRGRGRPGRHRRHARPHRVLRGRVRGGGVRVDRRVVAGGTARRRLGVRPRRRGAQTEAGPRRRRPRRSRRRRSPRRSGGRGRRSRSWCAPTTRPPPSTSASRRSRT